MGTTYNVKIANPPASLDANGVRVAIDEVLATIDLAMSSYRDDSEISRFNAASATEWIEVSQGLAEVVTAAQEVSRQSGGALDITVAPLVNLWGFGRAGEPANLPDRAAVDAIRSTVGYQLLETRLSPPALRKKVPQLTIDLNAVAPGYAVDQLASKFAALGATDFMIDIGGEVLARGRNVQGEAWHIAVEKPLDAQPEPLVILRIPDRSVTTSGEYRHYYVRDGHRYSHTIDPRTGHPVEHSLASVVLIGSDTLSVDAWATALNVLGAQAGFDLATSRGMPAMFIEMDGTKINTRRTPEFGKYVIQP
jgi:thiamine biosynthesis lipoprotein